MCWCWRLTRRDGTAHGFTDHDQDLTFAGTTFEAAAGFTASEIKGGVGLSVDNLEVTSAVSSDRLAEADLAAGLYDDAKVEIFRVNWQDTSQRTRMRHGSLGEVKRAGGAFAAEVRGLAHYLQQPKGRVFQYQCDADLGDARCKITVAGPTYSGTGTIIAMENDRRFLAAGLESYVSGWFTHGLISFTSGAANGQRIEVKRHALTGANATIDLWQPARRPIEIGQTFQISAGCDKQLTTCRDRFSNAVNFRGFPHMPGNDAISRISRPGTST